MSKQKKKYNKWKENDAETLMCPTYSYGLGETSPVCAVPNEIAIRSDDTGFILGKDYHSDPPCYVGMPKGAEGNIAVIGGNGSGKSACIAKPTLLRWKGPMCVTDIKGELSKYYAEHCNVGKYRSYRPYIVFDPTDPNGYSYDPFEILRRCDENGSDFICYIKEMALIISPQNNDEKYKYWEDAERRILTGMLIHHFKLGLSFSETICRILISNISSICEEIKDHGDTLSNSYIGMIDELSRKEIFEFDTGLRNKLTGFYDDRIQHFFRGKREGAKCLWWNDLDRYDIFIRIPENRVDIWGNAINLMYSQLIHYLESRPEKYSEEGANTEPVLLLMDEFPRFGKLNSIIPAITTLRSKNVNICLMLQSIAQLDMIYGQDCRRVIFDNCQYKAILNASDAETQRELSELIGTDRVLQSSISHTYNNDFKIVGSSIQNSCIREARVPPHELSALKDVIALTPYGNYCISKIIPSDEERDFEDYKEYLSKIPVIEVSAEASVIVTAEDADIPEYTVYPVEYESAEIQKSEVIMMSIEERTKAANQRAEKAMHEARVKQRAKQKGTERTNNRRNYIVGELVCKYFPQINDIEPGTNEENAERFALLDCFLKTLSFHPEIIHDILDEAQYMLDEEDNV